MIDDQIIAAVTTVHYFARAAVESALESAAPQFTGLPLADAVPLLAAGGEPIGEWRRRSAIVKLAAADFDLFSAELQTLRTPAEVETQLAGHPGLDLVGREELVDRLLGSPFPGCPTRHVRNHVSTDPASKVTIATATLEVRKHFTDVSRVLDPQTWSTCNDSFKNSYVALKRDGDYHVDANHDAEREPHPPTIGAHWDAVLFEHFQLGVTVPLSWFRNLLAIKSDPQPEGHRMDYRLYRSIYSQVGTQSQSGGIEVDGGYAVACRVDDEWTALECRKEIRFSPSDLGYPADVLAFWARVTLSMMGREIARAVCCPVRRAAARSGNA